LQSTEYCNTHSPVKDHPGPESPFIATDIYPAVIVISRETTWCWQEESPDAATHQADEEASVVANSNAQLYAMFCFLWVLGGDGK